MVYGRCNPHTVTYITSPNIHKDTVELSVYYQPHFYMRTLRHKGVKERIQETHTLWGEAEI